MWRKAKTYYHEAIKCYDFMRSHTTKAQLGDLEKADNPNIVLFWYRTPDMKSNDIETCERIAEIPANAIITGYRMDIWNGQRAYLDYPTYDIETDSFEFDLCNEDGEELGPATFTMKEIKNLARKDKKIIITTDECKVV